MRTTEDGVGKTRYAEDVREDEKKRRTNECGRSRMSTRQEKRKVNDGRKSADEREEKKRKTALTP